MTEEVTVEPQMEEVRTQASDTQGAALMRAQSRVNDLEGALGVAKVHLAEVTALVLENSDIPEEFRKDAGFDPRTNQFLYRKPVGNNGAGNAVG